MGKINSRYQSLKCDEESIKDVSALCNRAINIFWAWK